MRAPAPLRLTTVVTALLLGCLGAGSAVLAAAGAAAPKADLTVAATRTLAFTATPGGLVRVRADVTNVGKVRAGASTAGLYLSRSSKPGADARRLDTAHVARIEPSRTVRPVLAGTLPDPLAAGTWRLVVCADIADRVKERTGSNNCRVWRTFAIDEEPEPPVEQGPIGGATASCGGTYRPFQTPAGSVPSGVHLSVVGPVVDEVVVTHQADAVGFEALESDEEYRHTVVTLVNDGTAATGAISVDAVSCEYDRDEPDYWSIVEDDHGAALTEPRCGGQLLPGAMCQISIFASDIRRGGTDLPGAIRVFGYVAGDPTSAMWATFPILSSATSRGYLSFTTLEASGMSGVPAGSARYTIVEATNTGDRLAVPTFAIDDAPGTPPGIFSQGGPDWDPVDGGTRCETSYSAGPPPVTIGAIAPGTSCQFRIRACTLLQQTTYAATLFARNAYENSAENYSAPYDLVYSTTDGDGTCDG